jgi:CTP:phosphocholine cytidylyltransferase-like protein
MASQRISKTAIDWAKFASLIPKHDKNYFATFKAKHDEYMVRWVDNGSFDNYQKSTILNHANEAISNLYIVLFSKTVLQQTLRKHQRLNGITTRKT